MKKVLVIVDMQNDFLTGALGFEDGVKIIPGIKQRMDEALAKGWDVLFTLDTHDESYLSSREGRNLPVIHCIKDTDGWKVTKELTENISESENVYGISKSSFGADFVDLSTDELEEIEICGVVTDMCVISCAISLQTAFPNAEITILKDLCASPNKEMEQQALNLMKNLQMKIK